MKKLLFLQHRNLLQRMLNKPASWLTPETVVALLGSGGHVKLDAVREVSEDAEEDRSLECSNSE